MHENFEETKNTFCSDFYERCIKDNFIISDLAAEDKTVRISHLSLIQLKDILFHKLKLNKAADVYMLTVDHLRYAGDQVLLKILDYLNSVIDNLNSLSCPQLKLSVGTMIHKGKDKSKNHHKSFREVRVSALFGRIIDEHIRPTTVAIARPLQSINQYGFTENISYLMGALGKM